MRIKGIVYASLASSLWSISGVSGEVLFKRYGFSAEWLVSIRTLISGIVLLGIVRFIEKKDIFAPFKKKEDRIKIILFGVAGMYLVQATYFKTIEMSNVSFATILQFTAPFFIFIYEAVKNRKMPSVSTVILLIMTAVGVDLVATKGNFSNLSWSMGALLLGLFSAIMIAFYTIYPKNLLEKYSSMTVVGWGMIIGSGIANFIHPFWKVSGEVNTMSLIHVGVVVILGTAVAYLIFITSLKYISSSLAGILTAFEPSLATLLSVALFGLSLSFSEGIGFTLVFSSILILQNRL